ncbi:MAG: hypothetical protein OXI91_00205 [Chloroflexota bacterium]|nr:hypothetical protein [Chloroflexota bacterium]
MLDARDQLPSEMKRALGAAIRNSGVRVPGAQFQLKDVQDAPTHHLQSPVLRKMQSSDELAEAILRAWSGIRSELYESVVQHLQWNDEPTYGPDRKELCFRGYWDARDWQTNFNQFLADRTGFDKNDAGLMIWYVSGKLPPPYDEVQDPTGRVDFGRWKDLLLALRSDAPQWEEALEFAAAIGDIVVEKEKQRAREAVNQLKARIQDIWLEYSEELVYLERSISEWSAARNIQPEVAVETLAQVNYLDSLLEQYRPIRDQAQSRSVESSRAGRRAELEADIISTVSELETIFSSNPRRSFPEPKSVAEEPMGITPTDPAPVAAPDSDTPTEEPEIAPVAGTGSVPDETQHVLNLDPNPLPMEREPELATDMQGKSHESAPLDLTPAAEPEPEIIPAELAIDPVGGPEWNEMGSDGPVANGSDPGLPVAGEIETPGVDESSVNGSLIEGLQSLREDLELLKAQLASTGSTEAVEQRIADLELGLLAETQSPVPALGLADVVGKAEEVFSRQLQFRLNSESLVNGNPFDDPQAVSDALEWLASTYYAARQGELDIAHLNDSLYRACRWRYSSNQHDRQFFENEGQYRMLVNGRAYFLNETIGKGTGGDPVNTIRIAFYWDRQRHKVVIGYIGQHRAGYS